MKKMMIVLTFFVGLYGCNNEDNSNEQAENPNIDTTILVTDTTANIAPEEEGDAFVYGIDISKYQGDEVEFLNKSTDSLSFIFCKGTEGNTYTDPDFTQNWNTIEEKGFIRGVYHFYRSDDDPQTQASNFLSVLGDLKAVDFSPVVDVEGGGLSDSQTIAEVQQGLIEFLNIIEEQTGRTPIIYTNVSVGDNYFSAEDFAKYPLWIADYSGADQPRMPGIWANTKWTLWQQSDAYEINTNLNDFDIFNGNIVELKGFIESY